MEPSRSDIMMSVMGTMKIQKKDFFCYGKALHSSITLLIKHQRRGLKYELHDRTR